MFSVEGSPNSFLFSSPECPISSSWSDSGLSYPSRCKYCSLPWLDNSIGWLILPWGFSTGPNFDLSLMDHLCFWGMFFARVFLFLFGIGLGAGRAKPPSRANISSSELDCCWARLELTISLIRQWWLTTVSMCWDHLNFWVVSCSKEFNNASKFTEHFRFRTAKSLSWRGLTTSLHSSHVM